jgi:hypothetical protein
MYSNFLDAYCFVSPVVRHIHFNRPSAHGLRSRFRYSLSAADTRAAAWIQSAEQVGDVGRHERDDEAREGNNADSDKQGREAETEKQTKQIPIVAFFLVLFNFIFVLIVVAASTITLSVPAFAVASTSPFHLEKMVVFAHAPATVANLSNLCFSSSFFFVFFFVFDP